MENPPPEPPYATAAPASPNEDAGNPNESSRPASPRRSWRDALALRAVSSTRGEDAGQQPQQIPASASGSNLFGTIFGNVDADAFSRFPTNASASLSTPPLGNETAPEGAKTAPPSPRTSESRPHAGSTRDAFARFPTDGAALLPPPPGQEIAPPSPRTSEQSPPPPSDAAPPTTTTTTKSTPAGAGTTADATPTENPLLTHAYPLEQGDDELVEFGLSRPKRLFWRMLYAIERDVLNWYSALVSLISHGWGFEAFLTIAGAVASTCCFTLIPYSGQYLAARLDFTIIGSAVVFPTTFLIAETFRRREGAIQRLASIKALLCQLLLAYLTWRWKGDSDMGEEWEERVHKDTRRMIRTMTAVLRLPTWNTNRHIYTKSGQEFKAQVIQRERELMARIGHLFSNLHTYTEDLKRKGLPPNEASRVNQYLCLIQIDFEALVMVKCYRTPNIARSFVRWMVLVCPIFYGPYFAWVSGIIGGGAQTNLAFAIALTVLTVFILLGLVRVQRSMEDPFRSSFPGDVIDMFDELRDTESRLDLILAHARLRRRGEALKMNNSSGGQQQ